MLIEEIPASDTSEHGPPVLRRRRSKRGGNRLSRDHPNFPISGRSYDRRHNFDVDPDPRHEFNRQLTEQAARTALATGELTHLEYALLMRLIDQCGEDTLLKPAPARSEGKQWPRCSGWWSTEYIRGLIRNAELEEWDPGAAAAEAAEDQEGHKRTYDRTAGAWMKSLYDKGWLDKIHRSGHANGEPFGKSNLWRIQTPPELRQQVEAIWKAKAARTAAETIRERKSARKRPPNGPGGQRAPRTADEARQALEKAIRNHPCPLCNGVGTEPDPIFGGSRSCSQCEGRRTLAAP